MPANLTIAERAQIIAQFNEGYSISAISRNLNTSRSSVRFWIRREGEEGSLLDRRRSGRRPALSNNDREFMRREYETNGFIPTNYFAEIFDVSAQTIRSHLHHMGLHHRHYAKKMYLTDAHRLARLNFAREHLDFDWSNTIFCDEKTFKSNQHGHLWRYNSTRYRDDHVIPNRESGQISVNIWGWMSADGVGELCSLPPRATAVNYIDVLQSAMLPTVRNVYPESKVPQLDFVQDNCSIYNARIVRAWFRSHTDLKVIPWPSRSPDLNPIEHLWGLMVQRWSHQNERTKEALINHCNIIWEEMRGTDICLRLVNSMRSRLLDVIEANGSYTRF